MSASNNDILEQKLVRLEEELSSMKACLLDGVKKSQNPRAKLLRRGSILAGTLVCGVSIAGIFYYYQSGASLAKIIQHDASVRPSRLDSMAIWSRTDAAGAGKSGYTTELLSLIADGTQTDSYQWPLYVELRGTTSPSATQPSSQSVGATARSIVRSAGSPWTVGFHSEVAHGANLFGPGSTPIATNGTSILFNGEIRSFSTGGLTTGVNLQCVYQDSNSKYCDNGINIQTGGASTPWKNGIHFDTTGNYINGNIGINFDQAQYNMGIDLANNSLRLNAGQKFVLEEHGQVYITYNQNKNRVEIWKNGAVVASF